MQTNVMESESNGHPLSLLIDARGDFWLKTSQTCVPLEQFHARTRPRKWMQRPRNLCLSLQHNDVAEVA